jgi:hypothetical protein
MFLFNKIKKILDGSRKPNERDQDRKAGDKPLCGRVG